MSERKGDRFLVVKRFGRNDVPRRLCQSLRQARSVAAACQQTWLATKIDERLAGCTIGSQLCCVAIYRLDRDGRVVEYIEAI